MPLNAVSQTGSLHILPSNRCEDLTAMIPDQQLAYTIPGRWCQHVRAAVCVYRL